MGDSKRRPLAGRRSVLLGMAGLATAALAACADNGRGALPDAAGPGQMAPGSPSNGPGVVPPNGPGAGPATPPPSIAALSSEQAAAALAAKPGSGEGGSGDAGDQSPVPPSSAPALPAAIPGKPQILAEFGSLRPQEWGLHVTGVVNNSASRHVALTFDACGGPGGTGCDHKLLKSLRSLNVPATLFINSRWINANKSLAAELAADPLFELSNHGTLHLPLSVNGKSAYGIAGTANPAAVYEELMGNQALMHELTGVSPRFFRPGTAFYDDVAASMTRRLGMLPVNFTINGDGGATFAPATVAGEVAKAGAGDIVISHFNRPGAGTAEGYARALPRLLDRGVTFARLGDVLPV
ncbi:polysaccharide deacetylase family protein [Paenarthrobacter sp. 2TAF44]|uniref:polysaccharide deacetylase family protein n=1 Tax=Paenarthrobacter sp. 2TAF44 TaxID=3233018 RepID=UPI003F989B51